MISADRVDNPVATILRFLLSLALIYLALAVMMTLMQGRLIYLPMSALVTSPADRGLEYEEVWLTTEDDVRLHAWYLPGPASVPAADGRTPTLLFLHGNAGNISHRLDSLEIFHDLGLAVLILDYRGYGQSEGRPSEQGLYRDARAGWRYLRDRRGVDAGDIVIFGRSLGGAVAAWLAARKQPGGVILESTFTSAADLGADLYPWLPVRWMLRVEYDALAAVRELSSPLLVAHSPGDEIVPFAHGLRLYEAAPGPRHLLEMSGGHNTGFLVTGERYRVGMSDFFSQVLDARRVDNPVRR